MTSYIESKSSSSSNENNQHGLDPEALSFAPPAEQAHRKAIQQELTIPEDLQTPSSPDSDGPSDTMPQASQRNNNIKNITDSGEAPFTFSACMHVRDENILLPEWLAYHFQTLPLRRIIITRDPLAKTDPRFILRQFEELGLDWTILEYDDYFFPGYWIYNTEQYNFTHFINDTGVYENPKEGTIYNEYHRHRQRMAMIQCFRQLKREGRKWTIVTDPDEYVTFDPLVIDYDSEYFTYPRECYSKSRGKQRNDCMAYYEEHNMTGPTGIREIRSHLPSSTFGKRTLAHFLHENLDDIIKWNPSFSKPCWILSRFPMSSYEEETSESMVPDGLDRKSFYTMRFRQEGENAYALCGKSIVDVSEYDHYYVDNPHMTFPAFLCSHFNCFPRRHNGFLRVLHYTGSLEFFLSRHKPLKQFVMRQPDYVVSNSSWAATTWLKPFVERVGGVEQAKRYTQELQQQAMADYENAYGTPLLTILPTNFSWNKSDYMEAEEEEENEKEETKEQKKKKEDLRKKAEEKKSAIL